MTKLPESLRARLFTVFGTVIYVDPSSGALRHGPVESSPANAFYGSGESTGAGRRKGQLIYTDSDSPEPIHCSPDICLTASQARRQNWATGPSTFELIPLERGLLTLKSGELFLSAIPDGDVKLRAPVCNTWELYIASESWCTDGDDRGNAWRTSTVEFENRSIQSYIVDPIARTRSGIASTKPKILIYGYTKWSHGRVYYDICNILHRNGYVVDILDWQKNHIGYIDILSNYYDLCITSLDGVHTLVDLYKIPYDKIVAISHHEFDMRMLVERKGADVFDKFANYGVVSEYLYSASVMRGVSRLPRVAALGIDYQNFFAPLPTHLTTVGYATSMAVHTYGVEWKRGELAEAAVQEAGLAFKVAGSTANQILFHDMPKFYQGVDAVVTSSVNESGPLSVMEGAAAGRLVIGTPVGHFPLKAYQGGGIIAPIEPDKFKAFTTATLRYYKENSAAFVERCHATREAAREFDWQHAIGGWIELLEQARPSSSQNKGVSISNSDKEYQFTFDWFSSNIATWNSLIDQIKPSRILEVGSFEGRSTCYLIEKCSRIGPIEIYCIDTWEGGIEHDKNAMGEVERRFDYNSALAMQRATHTTSVTKLKKTSTEALSELIARQDAAFDLVYIDGSHQAPDVLADAVLAFKMLRVGGLMIFDDYLWRLGPDGQQDPLNMPKPAIDAFVNIFQRKLRVMAGYPIWQLYIEKKFN